MEADRLLSIIQGRLKRVIDGDEQDARVLSARKQAVAGALRESHTIGEAMAAYHVRPERMRAPVQAGGELDEAS